MKKFHTFTSIVIILLISLFAAYSPGQDNDKAKTVVKTSNVEKCKTIPLIKVLNQN